MTNSIKLKKVSIVTKTRRRWWLFGTQTIELVITEEFENNFKHTNPPIRLRRNDSLAISVERDLDDYKEAQK